MDPSIASANAFEVVVRFFEEDGWNFLRRDEKLLLQLGCAGKNGHYMCLAHVVESRPVVRFVSIAGLRVPEEKRQAMAEFLTRANYGLCLGNFEMDFADGEVRYKTSVDVCDGTLTTDMVRAFVHANLSTMDRYFSGMMSIMWTETTPETAIGKIESDAQRRFPWQGERLRRMG